MYFTFAYKTPGAKPDALALEQAHKQIMVELGERNIEKVLACGPISHAVLTGLVKPLAIHQTRGRGEWITLDGLAGEYRAYLVTTYPPFYVVRDSDTFRDLVFDLRKWVEKWIPVEAPKIKLIIPNTFDELKRYLQLWSTSEFISCDIEATGFDALNDHILSLGFGILPFERIEDGRESGSTLLIDQALLAKPGVRELISLFLTNGHTFIFHNAKFDLKFLAKYTNLTVIRQMKIADTMLMHYVLDERAMGGNSESSQFLGAIHGLKTLARQYFDASAYKIDFEKWLAVPEANRDWTSLFQYQSLDLIYTAALYYIFEAQIDEQSLQLVLDKLLIPATKAFAEIELGGALIDRTYLTQLHTELEVRLKAMLARLCELVRTMDTRNPGLRHYIKDIDKFNPNSPKQVSEALYKLMPLPTSYNDNGNLSTDKDTLKELQRYLVDKDAPVAKEFVITLLEYRGLVKVLTTYVDGLLEQSKYDGHVHPDFQISGTSTGRLSCREPNLQNMPILSGREIRSAFIAPPGYVFMNADYSQLELRIAAFYSQDETMISAYRDKRDIHREVASAMYGKPADQITDDERYAAKYVDFGILYGRSAQSLSDSPELVEYSWTVEEAQQFIEKFLGQFAGLRSWMEATKLATIKNHGSITPTGRKRRFPYITQYNRGAIERQGVNTPIQSLASDVCLNSLLKLHSTLREYAARIVLSVHDSISFYVPVTRVEECAKLIYDQMTTDFVIPINVPISVKIEAGTNWGNLAEVGLQLEHIQAAGESRELNIPDPKSEEPVSSVVSTSQ